MTDVMTWNNFCKKYASHHSITYSQALQCAKPSWEAYKASIAQSYDRTNRTESGLVQPVAPVEVKKEPKKVRKEKAVDRKGGDDDVFGQKPDISKLPARKPRVSKANRKIERTGQSPGSVKAEKMEEGVEVVIVKKKKEAPKKKKKIVYVTDSEDSGEE